MLEVESLEFCYGETRFSFDFAVAGGEVLGVIGPSGAGKSTLLNLVGGFLQPSRGTIRIDGENITHQQPERRPVTTVFQEHNLFPHLSVFDNVALGITPRLKVDRATREQVLQALEQVQLSGIEKRRPGELSGGQRQRVTLARAMVRGKPVLLLDEPMTALGPALRRELIELIHRLVVSRGLAAILVSHHPEDARLAADRVAFLYEGRIDVIGKTESVFSAPGNPRLRAYLGDAS